MRAALVDDDVDLTEAVERGVERGLNRGLVQHIKRDREEVVRRRALEHIAQDLRLASCSHDAMPTVQRFLGRLRPGQAQIHAPARTTGRSRTSSR